jgi:hypothetical protein
MSTSAQGHPRNDVPPTITLERRDLISGKYVGIHKVEGFPLVGKVSIRVSGFDEKGSPVSVMSDSVVVVPVGATILRLDQEYIESDSTGYTHKPKDPKYPHNRTYLTPSKYLDTNILKIPSHSTLLHQVLDCYWGHSDSKLESIGAYTVFNKLNTDYTMHGDRTRIHSISNL